VKALFADLAEVSRQRRADGLAHRASERRRVLALCDAIQVAHANGQHLRVSVLLKEMNVIVSSALARRRGRECGDPCVTREDTSSSPSGSRP
jgi:hypothetical protein